MTHWLVLNILFQLLVYDAHTYSIILIFDDAVFIYFQCLIFYDAIFVSSMMFDFSCRLFWRWLSKLQMLLLECFLCVGCQASFTKTVDSWVIFLNNSFWRVPIFVNTTFDLNQLLPCPFWPVHNFCQVQPWWALHDKHTIFVRSSRIASFLMKSSSSQMSQSQTRAWKLLTSQDQTNLDMELETGQARTFYYTFSRLCFFTCGKLI